MQVLDGCGALLVRASEPQRDQYTFQSRVRSAITISHLIRNKANMLTQSPSTVTTVGGLGGGSWVADRDIIHIYSAEILH